MRGGLCRWRGHPLGGGFDGAEADWFARSKSVRLWRRKERIRGETVGPRGAESGLEWLDGPAAAVQRPEVGVMCGRKRGGGDRRPVVSLLGSGSRCGQAFLSWGWGGEQHLSIIFLLRPKGEMESGIFAPRVFLPPDTFPLFSERIFSPICEKVTDCATLGRKEE